LTIWLILIVIVLLVCIGIYQEHARPREKKVPTRLKPPDHPHHIVVGSRLRPAQRGHVARPMHPTLPDIGPNPTTFDFGPKAAKTLSEILDNSQLGDCTEAGILHVVGVTSANSGFGEVPMGDADAIKLYEVDCGYNPSDPSTDQGGDEQTVLNGSETHGVPYGKQKTLGYVSVDPKNPALYTALLWRFGNLYFGAELVKKWADNFASGMVWDMGNPDPSYGHAFAGYARVKLPDGRMGIKVSTWGDDAILPDNVIAYVVGGPNFYGELYCVARPEWYDPRTGMSPAGYHYTQDATLWAQLAPGSKPWPAWTGPPAPSPTPPGPTPPGPTPPGPTPPTPVTSASISISPTSIQSGQAATLSWTASGGAFYEISDGIVVSGAAASGMRQVSPISSTTYTLSVFDQTGKLLTSSSCSLSVSSSPTPPTPPPGPTPPPVPPPQPPPSPTPIIQQVDAYFAKLEKAFAGYPAMVNLLKAINTSVDRIIAIYAVQSATAAKRSIPPWVIMLVRAAFTAFEVIEPQYAAITVQIEEFVVGILSGSPGKKVVAVTYQDILNDLQALNDNLAQRGQLVDRLEHDIEALFGPGSSAQMLQAMLPGLQAKTQALSQAIAAAPK
jgi:hypothetical protein